MMMKKLQIEEFSKLVKQEMDILDTRPVEEFKAGFIPSSINIPLKGIKDWAPGVLKKQEPLLLVTEPGKEEETEAALKAAGYNKVEGFLNGGFEKWKTEGNRIDMIIDVESDELMMDIPFDDNLVIVDVRKPMEFAEGHLRDAMNIPLNEMNDPLKISGFGESDNLYLYCGGGTRSVIAASVLKKHGVHNLRNIVGGWKKIKDEPNAEIVKEPDVLN